MTRRSSSPTTKTPHRKACETMLAQAVEHLIKNIVDFPDDVSVKSHENARGELIRVRVNPEDIGRVIGRNGRTANAVRTVIQAISDHKVRVDIMDVRK